VADVPPLILVGSELGCDRQLLGQQQVARPPDKDIVSASGRLRPDVQGGGFFYGQAWIAMRMGGSWHG